MLLDTKEREKLREIVGWKLLARKNLRPLEMRKETFLKRQLQDKLNLHQERVCLIKDSLIRLVASIQVLVMKMITIYMISHYSLIELLHRFIKVLKRFRMMIMSMLVIKAMLKKFLTNNHREASREQIIQRVQDKSQSNSKRNHYKKIMLFHRQDCTILAKQIREKRFERFCSNI